MMIIAFLQVIKSPGAPFSRTYVSPEARISLIQELQKLVGQPRCLRIRSRGSQRENQSA